MEELVQLQNFRDMLRKELTYRNMVALNATSKASRGMFDNKAYASHQSALLKVHEEYTRMWPPFMDLKRDIIKNAEGYLVNFGALVAPDVNRMFRAVRSEIQSEQKEVIFAISLLIMAASDMYPWFREAWTKFTRNKLPEGILPYLKATGLNFVFRATGVSKTYAAPKRLLKHVRPLVTYIDQNRYTVFIYIAREAAIEHAKSKILGPLASWMAAKDAILKKRAQVLKVVAKTGDDRILEVIREFDVIFREFQE